jgi:hypothetical protein
MDELAYIDEVSACYEYSTSQLNLLFFWY